jgi:predicted nucleic acid-binding protein
MSRYVLDACALVALLKGEPGAEKVAAAFDAAYKKTATIVMNKINLLEVYYDAYRTHGKEQADLMLANLKKGPVAINPEISDDIFAAAGRMKAVYRISLADSIALAQALTTGGELLTADHHEFDKIEGIEPISFNWIR